MTDTITNTIVESIADQKDIDPEEVDPLYDTVDPDALEAIAEADVRLRFTHNGCIVTIRDGQVMTTDKKGIQGGGDYNSNTTTRVVDRG